MSKRPIDIARADGLLTLARKWLERDDVLWRLVELSREPVVGPWAADWCVRLATGREEDWQAFDREMQTTSEIWDEAVQQVRREVGAALAPLQTARHDLAKALRRLAKALQQAGG